MRALFPLNHRHRPTVQQIHRQGLRHAEQQRVGEQQRIGRQYDLMIIHGHLSP